MAKKEKLRDAMRKLYVYGSSVDEIATFLDCSVRKVRYHKAIDQEEGRDWDKRRLEYCMSDTDLESRNRAFLSLMFSNFEKAAKNIGDTVDPEKQLALLTKYTNSYQRLMSTARQAKPMAEIQEVAVATIRLLAKDAVDNERPELSVWILERLDAIQEKIRKEFSS